MSKVIVLAEGNRKVISLSANYITSDLVSVLSAGEREIDELSVTHFVELMTMLEEGKIGSRVAKDLLVMLLGSTVGPSELAEKNNLLQVSDSSALQSIIDEIIANNSSVVGEYKSGKEASLQFLIGQGMKMTKGSANPTLLRDMIIQSLK